MTVIASLHVPCMFLFVFEMCTYSAPLLLFVSDLIPASLLFISAAHTRVHVQLYMEDLYSTLARKQRKKGRTSDVHLDNWGVVG